MRTPFVMLAAALLAAGACSPFGGAEPANEAAAGPDREAGELALVSIVRAPDGSCTVRWDGQPVADSAVQERAVRVLEALIQQLGGPQNLTTMPKVVLEAPQDAPYTCFRSPIDQLASAGFAEIALRFAGRGPGADRIIRVPFPSASQPLRPFATFDLRADGSVHMDGHPLDPAQLRERLVNTAVAPEDLGLVDGSVLVHVDPTATFAALHQLVGVAMEGDRQVLVRPRDEAGSPAPVENSQTPAP